MSHGFQPRKLRLLQISAIFIAAFVLLALFAAPANANSAGPIYNGTGWCMGVQGSSRVSGAAILVGGCAGTATQHWDVRSTRYVPNGQVGFQLWNGYPGGVRMCLGVQGSSTVSGARMVQGNCVNDTAGGHLSQFWIIPSGSSQLINALSGWCMGLVGGRTDSGTAVDQGHCVAHDLTQEWYGLPLGR